MRWVAVAAAAAFLASFGGALHPALDTLAIARVPLALVVLATLAARRVRRRAMVPVALLAAGWLLSEAVWRLAPPAPGAATDATLTIYQRNLWFANTEFAALLAEIEAHAPDVITLQEVSNRNAALLSELRPTYPHQVFCRFSGWSGIAVLSKLPPGGAAPHCSAERGLAALQVATPEGPGWVLSVHLYWPWPYDQGPQVTTLAQDIATLAGPKIVVGDFNTLPWSHAIRSLRHSSGTRYIGPRAPTYSLRHLPLGLDHVLAGAGRVTILPKTGSDHHGLLAQVRFP